MEEIKRKTRYHEMIEDIRSAEGCVSGGITLTEWEEEFVASVDERLTETGALSAKQCEALENIWNRI